MPAVKTEANVVGSAVKVLRALRVLCAADEPVLAARLATELGTSPATAFRVAETLVHAGFARREAFGPGYVPTMDVVELSGLILGRTEITGLARPALTRLARRFGETVTLAVPDGDHVVFVDRIEGARTVRFYCDIGRRLPLHAGAAARCVMAHLPQHRFDAFLTAERERLTPSTRTSADELIADRAAIRAAGYAESLDEVDIGVSAVGVPILNADGKVLAAVAIASLSVRWGSEDRAARATAMRAVAVELCTAGGPLPAEAAG